MYLFSVTSLHRLILHNHHHPSSLQSPWQSLWSTRTLKVHSATPWSSGVAVKGHTVDHGMIDESPTGQLRHSTSHQQWGDEGRTLVSCSNFTTRGPARDGVFWYWWSDPCMCGMVNNLKYIACWFMTHWWPIGQGVCYRYTAFHRHFDSDVTSASLVNWFCGKYAKKRSAATRLPRKHRISVVFMQRHYQSADEIPYLEWFLWRWIFQM